MKCSLVPAAACKTKIYMFAKGFENCFNWSKAMVYNNPVSLVNSAINKLGMVRRHETVLYGTDITHHSQKRGKTEMWRHHLRPTTSSKWIFTPPPPKKKIKQIQFTLSSYTTQFRAAWYKCTEQHNTGKETLKAAKLSLFLPSLTMATITVQQQSMMKRMA